MSAKPTIQPTVEACREIFGAQPRPTGPPRAGHFVRSAWNVCNVTVNPVFADSNHGRIETSRPHTSGPGIRHPRSRPHWPPPMNPHPTRHPHHPPDTPPITRSRPWDAVPARTRMPTPRCLSSSSRSSLQVVVVRRRRHDDHHDDHHGVLAASQPTVVEMPTSEQTTKCMALARRVGLFHAPGDDARRASR